MSKQKKNIEVKRKLINYLIVDGKKSKCEKIVSKSFKTLQMLSTKSSKKLVQLALVLNSPIFKLNTITPQKRKKKKQKSKIIPAFIYKKSSRMHFAIKFIVVTAQKKKKQSIFTKLPEEILLSSLNKSNAIETKKDNQKQALLNRHLFKYYRWH